MGAKERLKQFSSYSRQREQAVFEQLRAEVSPADNLMHAGDMLSRADELFPHKTALECQSRVVTYRQLYSYAIRLAQIFAQHNVVRGDRVIIYYENSIEFYIAYFATWHLRAVAVPINIFFHEKELGHIINDAQPKLVFTMPAFVANLEKAISSGYMAAMPTLLTAQAIDWQQDTPPSVGHQEAAPCQDELALLLYTSGTTGVPKGVMLSSRNIMTNALQVFARFSIAGDLQDERFFCVLPLFHVFAQNTCIWAAMLTGSTVIIVPKIDRKLILEGLAKKPTVFFGFPALYGLLCLMRTAPLGSVKLFVSGADAMPDKIRAGFAAAYGRKICSGYGLTEAAPVIAVQHENLERPTNVVGYPLVNVACSIRDESGTEMPNGSIGTLWVKGDNVMLGYYGATEATEAVLQNGWLCTGDLARLDQAGMLAICGRSKDLIIHKGFNIYPQEIENILMKHPQVFKAAVVGRAEEMTGQVPVAYVATRTAGGALEEDLRKLCSDHLASYKIPKTFICLEDLPMSPTGKVDKKQLKQDGA